MLIAIAKNWKQIWCLSVVSGCTKRGTSVPRKCSWVETSELVTLHTTQVTLQGTVLSAVWVTFHNTLTGKAIEQWQLVLPGSEGFCQEEAGCEGQCGHPVMGGSLPGGRYQHPGWHWLSFLEDVNIRGTWVWGTEDWFVFSLIVVCESIMISK